MEILGQAPVQTILFIVIYTITGVVPLMAVLFVIYAVYTSNMGEMAREYLSQVISIVIIAFLLWRVETLEELPSEEDMDVFQHELPRSELARLSTYERKQ